LVLCDEHGPAPGAVAIRHLEVLPLDFAVRGGSIEPNPLEREPTGAGGAAAVPATAQLEASEAFRPVH
jgi:hypothetical protein